MNIETTIEPRLWNIVRVSIENRNYTGAILDAVHFLTDVIRERSGLDGDGVALIGEAFGGRNPKLKVNRLQTESEQNVQRGIEQLLRGFYQAVRNPRSHESHKDEERDARELILFVNYLLRMVDQSGSPFSISAIIARVLDPDFVSTDRYARLLLNEIPLRKRLAVCREIFAQRERLNRDKIRNFVKTLVIELSEEDKSEFYSIVSGELRSTTDNDTIQFVLDALPSEYWTRVDEIARIRIETKLIASVKDGTLSSYGDCLEGGLGIFASDILLTFTLCDELWSELIRKIGSSNDKEQAYASEFFLSHVDKHFAEPPQALVSQVNRRLNHGDKCVHDLVKTWSSAGNYASKPHDHPWVKPFAEALVNYNKIVQKNLEETIPF